MKRILYTSKEVRQAITDLFSSSSGRRIAITAFVGDGAEAYLPKPQGLELFCWPQVGGTNPNALRKLMKRGVQVSFVDLLHMKVYWTEDRGAIVTSANLSTNALGAGNLREIGVLLSPGELDIDRIISSLRLREVTPSELRRLDREYGSYVARNRVRVKPQTVSFDEWYHSPSRPDWKLGWWETYGPVSLNAMAVSKNEYGVAEPRNFLGSRPKDFQEGDWALCFRLGTRVSQFGWMRIDFVVPVSKSDKKAYDPDYSCQAVQVWPLKVYLSPPFHIDERFRNAFRKAVDDYGASLIMRLRSLKPSARLVDLIYRYYIGK